MASFVCSISNYFSEESTPYALADYCYSAVPDGSAFSGCMRAQMSCRVYVASEPDTVRIYSDSVYFAGLEPVESGEVMETFHEGFMAGLLSVSPFCFGLFAVMVVVFLFNQSFRQKGW
jgi:hypothetical protein